MRHGREIAHHETLIVIDCCCCRTISLACLVIAGARIIPRLPLTGAVPGRYAQPRAVRYPEIACAAGTHAFTCGRCPTRVHGDRFRLLQIAWRHPKHTPSMNALVVYCRVWQRIASGRAGGEALCCCS